MLKIDKNRLTEAIKAFYITTGVKIAIYDTDFTEITAYPEKQGAFCSLMNSCSSTRAKCQTCTAELFARCTKSANAPLMHKCHAGLTEVACPLTDRGTVIGFAIFGQITNESDRNAFVKDVLRRCAAYECLDAEIIQALDSVKYYSEEQIQAISFLLNITVSYIISNRLAYADPETLGAEVKDYILENLSADLNVRDICKHFFVSRSMLYKITATYMPEGILAFIKAERLKLAEKLLAETDMTLSDIAAAAGFHDVEYFQRTFKKATGLPVNKFRKGARLN